MRIVSLETLYRILFNTPMGMLVGAWAMCSIGLFIDLGFREVVLSSLAHVVPPIITLLAAALALAGVHATNVATQTEAGKTRASELARETEARDRRLLAAKANFPLYLSEMSRVCRSGIQNSLEFENRMSNLGRQYFQAQSIEQLSLSEAALRNFELIIETHDRPEVAVRLAGLLREYQIFFARWTSEFEPSPMPILTSPEDARRRTVSWAYLSAITSSLFDYAREGDELTEVTDANIRGALALLLPLDLEADDFVEEIGLYHRTFQRRFT